jgi:threonine/homoserine/homoserine lactone efflux protein
LAHIVRPELFKSINHWMFTHNIRRHVYINGAIETLLGVAVIAPPARRFVPVLGALYVTYLGGNIIRRRRASWLHRSIETASIGEIRQHREEADPLGR